VRLPSRPLGLRNVVTLGFGALALVVSLVLAVGTYLTARYYLIEQREQAAARQAFADASFVRDGLLTSGVEVDDVLAATSPPAGAVIVLKRAGQWYSSSLSEGTQTVPAGLRATVVDGSAGSTWGRLAGEPAVAVGTPLPAVDAAFFEVVPAAELSSTLRTLGLALAGFAALTTVGGALIGRAAARRVVAPLDGIASASALIAGGEVDTRLGATDDPDLSVIVGSFNSMVDALQERHERDARFAADVSHELRSPVTAMMTAVEVLELGADDPTRRRQSTQLLRREVSRLRHALEQLLALGRLDAGVDEGERQPVELGDLVTNTLVLTRRPVALLSGAAEPVWVHADKGALRRTVVNLLDNADVHGHGTTSIRVVRDGPWGLLTVEDAGPGVPERERQRIFERFARSGSRAARPGTGLGLSLVAETIRAHGGDVWCEGSATGGARFLVRLPVVDPDAGDAP
jgi:signal transduction histidine kinase